ncbi:MAG: AbrB/MazE/SpoVT family DNA-binding domain-containing protein [Candidatus Nanopelagicales bacterium]
MSGTYHATMGDRGRLVVPAELRDRAGLREGRPLVFLETPDGLLLLTREQLRSIVRANLDGKDLVDSLLTERRTASADEDRG